MAALLKLLERHLGGRAWLALDRPSLADLGVAAMMTYFAPADFPAAEYPAIERWYSRVADLEAWQATADPLWS